MAAAELCAIGVYGLSVMGQNLALNIAQNAGVRTAVGNRSHEKVVATVERAAATTNSEPGWPSTTESSPK